MSKELSGQAYHTFLLHIYTVSGAHLRKNYGNRLVKNDVDFVFLDKTQFF